MKLDIQYIAGFVDGEGCIYAQVRENNRLDTRLTVTNTDLKTLLEIQEFFGCGKIREKSRSAKDIYTKICYVWEVWAKEAAVVIKQLLPFLRQKKKQAELILELREYCITRKSYKKGRCGVIPLSADEKARREGFVRAIKELKRA